VFLDAAELVQDKIDQKVISPDNDIYGVRIGKFYNNNNFNKITNKEKQKNNCCNN